MSKSRSLFEHRHYVEIARIIAEFGDRSAGYTYDRQDIASFFTDQLNFTNPAFNADRFYLAAIGKPPSSTMRLIARVDDGR